MEATHQSPDVSNYGGVCAMFTLGLEIVKQNVLGDMQLVLVAAQICLAVLGSAFYAVSIRKIKKEEK